MTFCWGRNTNLYQKTAGNLEQKKSCCCAHTQISSRNSQSLCSNFNTATSLVMEKLESNTTYKQVLTLNLDSEKKNWHMQEKSPAHPLQWPGRWMWVRRCWAEPQEDDADGHSTEQSLGVFSRGILQHWGLSVFLPLSQPSLAPGEGGKGGAASPVLEGTSLHVLELRTHPQHILPTRGVNQHCRSATTERTGGL